MQRLVIVGGKGGVGRTTVAVALARRLAGEGRRVLLAHVRCKRRLESLLGCTRVDETIRSVAQNLHVVNMNPRAALSEFGKMVLRFDVFARAVLESKLTKSFLRAVPALEDYSMIGKAWYHTTEIRDERSRFDTVVFDGPATGHLLSMLRIPQLIVESVPPGRLLQDAIEIYRVLTDPTYTAMVLVSLAEELPASETIDLHREVTTMLGIHVGGVVVNAVYPADFGPDPLTDEILRESTNHVGQPLESAIDAMRLFRARRLVNERYLDRLRGEFGAITELPYLFETLRPPQIEVLAAQLGSTIRRMEPPHNAD